MMLMPVLFISSKVTKYVGSRKVNNTTIDNTFIFNKYANNADTKEQIRIIEKISTFFQLGLKNFIKLPIRSETTLAHEESFES
jgi:hypothetical protein